MRLWKRRRRAARTGVSRFVSPFASRFRTCRAILWRQAWGGSNAALSYVVRSLGCCLPRLPCEWLGSAAVVPMRLRLRERDQNDVVRTLRERDQFAAVRPLRERGERDCSRDDESKTRARFLIQALVEHDPGEKDRYQDGKPVELNDDADQACLYRVVVAQP